MAIPSYAEFKDEMTVHEYVDQVVSGEIYGATLIVWDNPEYGFLFSILCKPLTYVVCEIKSQKIETNMSEISLSPSTPTPVEKGNTVRQASLSPLMGERFR